VGTDLSRRGFGPVLWGVWTSPVGGGGDRPDPSTVPLFEPVASA